MNRYYLSKRLEKVANMVEPAAFLVDIGCDHGFLAISLVKSGKAEKALCTDINEGPLQRAKEHIRDFNLQGKIETLLSDGLNELTGDPANLTKYEFDSCTICGMGGLMGVKIIFEAEVFFRKMRYFYLQLQSDIELVRLYLESFGYEIVFEDMVFEDGKYYTVMKVRNSDDKKESGSNEKNSRFDCGFDELPYRLKEAYDNLSCEESVRYKYPFYEGEDREAYKDFLEFMINKYTEIKKYLPERSDRLPVIEKELKIMSIAYETLMNS